MYKLCLNIADSPSDPMLAYGRLLGGIWLFVIIVLYATYTGKLFDKGNKLSRCFFIGPTDQMCTNTYTLHILNLFSLSMFISVNVFHTDSQNIL